MTVEGWKAAVGAVVVLAAINSVIWPLVARYLGGAILWTAGMLGLVANGLILLLASDVVPGFAVSDLVTAVWASLGMTAITAMLASCSPLMTMRCGCDERFAAWCVELESRK